MKTPQIICLTPVKNEAWILNRFLQCASLWADHIIIADQGSDDGSREIAAKYPKVTLINNPSTTFNEPERQQLLLKAARKFSEPRLLLALDADEILTANFACSTEWQDIRQASAGTVIYFRLANLRPDLRSYWSPDIYFPWGIMDDGSEHIGSVIHSPRVPINDNAPRLELKEINVLHYQYSNWERMESKHRWYQCWERLRVPQTQRRAINIFRQYHHMIAIPKSEFLPIPREWMAGYEEQGIDMTSVTRDSVYWWDREVLAWFAEHGTAKFKREAVWDVDWTSLAKTKDHNGSSEPIRDPRRSWDKLIHRWLRKTQPYHHQRSVQRLERVLGLMGW